ncbi:MULTISPECIES: hypothetical protein [unclassified Methanoregula]|uniref:hypothetical protein n=1 Tax=unclassified Methanoregula TaxID=2649730 RepID=UPI0009CE6329|nr:MULTISPECIES: hypothetical protein [unclassified Methanoregula]OPX62197.1 MAG: hypothetical protein A4E33_02463 [Methanoregula sp. PtaB.Bin085]OPY35594.1 MAG: hypothetical protein A4E34_00594 [Methanoregula sp. PtaU1.Bin006]
MSKGPQPDRGFDAALPVAFARGHVEFFRRTRGGTADLMVSGSGIIAIIRIRYAPRLYLDLAEIEWEFADPIARLRLHPAGSPVSRELWLYSRYGVLRFFRVLDHGIVEIGTDGKELAMAGPAKPEEKIQAVVEEKNPAEPEEKKPAAPEPAAAGNTPENPVASALVAVLPDLLAEEGPGGG